MGDLVSVFCSSPRGGEWGWRNGLTWRTDGYAEVADLPVLDVVHPSMNEERVHIARGVAV